MKNPLCWALIQRLGLDQQQNNAFPVLRKPHRGDRAGLKANVFASVMAMIYKYVLLNVGNEYTAFFRTVITGDFYSFQIQDLASSGLINVSLKQNSKGKYNMK